MRNIRNCYKFHQQTQRRWLQKALQHPQGINVLLYGEMRSFKSKEKVRLPEDVEMKSNHEP